MLKENSTIEVIWLGSKTKKEKKEKERQIKTKNKNIENGMGYPGIQLISDALKQHTSVHQLSLIDNDIGDDGAICCASLLRTNWTLKKLDLSSKFRIIFCVFLCFDKFALTFETFDCDCSEQNKI